MSTQVYLFPMMTESWMWQPSSMKQLRPSTALVMLEPRTWQPSPTSVFSISQPEMMAGGLWHPATQPCTLVRPQAPHRLTGSPGSDGQSG